MQRHRQNRLNWARVHTRWIRRRWNTLLFSESKFSLQRGDGRMRVYRRRNERYTDCCVLERDSFGSGGLSWSEQPWQFKCSTGPR